MSRFKLSLAVTVIVLVIDVGREIAFRRFRVTGSDPHGFEGDRDGIGCEP